MLILSVLILSVLACVQLYPVDAAFAQEKQPFYFYRGRVVSIVEKEPEQRLGAVEQTAQVLIIDGPFRGETIEIINTYHPEDPATPIYLRAGMQIIVAGQVVEGELRQAFVQDVVRERGLYFMLILFAALLLLIGKKQGVRTMLALLFTLLVVLVVILPLILRGFNPVLVSTLAATAIIIVTLPIIGGLNAKSISAIIGTVTGVTAAGLIAYLIGEWSYLTGFTDEEAQALFFMQAPVDIRGLLFAGIIIGSLGAATDVGMSVASAAAELSASNKNLKPAELTRASLNTCARHHRHHVQHPGFSLSRRRNAAFAVAHGATDQLAEDF